MNKSLESAIISNIKTQFPTAKVYTGLMIEGVSPDCFVINTITDNFALAQSNYRARNTVISVSVIEPTVDITDELVSCLQSFVVEDVTVFPDSLEVTNEDDVIRVFIDLTHIEQ